MSAAPAHFMLVPREAFASADHRAPDAVAVCIDERAATAARVHFRRNGMPHIREHRRTMRASGASWAVIIVCGAAEPWPKTLRGGAP